MIVAHLADLHLGYEAFERTERGRNVRERDVATAFQRAVHAIVRAAPDLILIVGDVFDRPDPPSGAFLALGRGLETLRVSLPGSTVLMVGGARDVGPSPGQPGPLAAMDAFPNVESADSTARSVHIGALDARVLLLPYPTLREPPAPAIHPDPKVRWNILALPGRPSERGPAVTVPDWDYIALGSRHVATAYAASAHDPGSLERLDPDPWADIETSKGFIVADLKAGTVEHHVVEGRPTVALARVRVDQGTKKGGIEGRIREVAREVPGGIEGRIVRLPLAGADPQVTAELEAGVLGELRSAALHLDVRPFGEGGSASDSWRGSEAGSDVDLTTVRWPEGFRLVPPAPADQQGLRAVVAEGRSALDRVLRAPDEAPDGVLDGAPDGASDGALDKGLEDQAGEGSGRSAGAVATGDHGALRMCWAGGHLRDPEQVAAECALALAEVVGLRRLGEEIRLLGFPLPSEEPGSADGDAVEAMAIEIDETRLRVSELESIGEELRVAEAEEQRLRGEAAEAGGDAEAAVMDWLRERQDAETTLGAYRDRAREMARRIGELEEKAGDAPCPTCGRPLADHHAAALAVLREEYDGVVQDGRWWRRRWEQLAEKAPEVRRREGDVVRLHAELEEAGERVHRARLGLREWDELRARDAWLVRRRAFLAGAAPDGDDPELQRAVRLRRDWLDGMAVARTELAARAGTYLVRISSGRSPGFVVSETGRLRAIGMGSGDGGSGASVAAALSLELAFAELVAEAAGERVGARGLVLAGALEGLAPDARVRAVALLHELAGRVGSVVVVLTPQSFGASREFFDAAFELTRKGSTRPLPSGPALVRLVMS